MDKQTPSKKDPHNLDVYCKDESEQDAALANLCIQPSIVAAQMIKRQYSDDDKLHLNALVSELDKQVTAVLQGNLEIVDSMLANQAIVLNNLFNDLVHRSRVNRHTNFEFAERYMKMALKTQSQCRSTLEALVHAKNPQAPIIQNNQTLVNQPTTTAIDQLFARVLVQADLKQVEENKKMTNELLEQQTDENEWLDIGAAATASSTYQELATVAAQHGAKN